MRYGEDPFEGLTGSRVSTDPAHEHFDFNDRLRYIAGETMLSDDIGNSFPFGRGFDKGYAVSLGASRDDALESLVANGLAKLASPHNSDLHSSVRGFVEYCASELLTSTVYIEIEYFTAPGNPAKPVAFLLHAPPPETIHERRRRYTQTVPHDRRGRILLPADRIVKIELPIRLRKAANEAVQLQRLGITKTLAMTDFVAGDYENTPGFDLKRHSELIDDIVLTGTREIGWMGRSSYSEGLLVAHKAWRSLQFARFQVSFREIVLLGLREAIKRAGRVIGFDAELRIDGLVSADDIAEMERQISDGSAPLSELFHPLQRPLQNRPEDSII